MKSSCAVSPGSVAPDETGWSKASEIMLLIDSTPAIHPDADHPACTFWPPLSFEGSRLFCGADFPRRADFPVARLMACST